MNYTHVRSVWKKETLLPHDMNVQCTFMGCLEGIGQYYKRYIEKQ